jgi:flagellar protein FliO/FliZ
VSSRFVFLINLLYFPAAALAQATAPVVAPPVAPVAPPAPIVPAPDFGGSVIQMFLGLILVLALLVGGLWLLKQLTQRRGEGSNLLRVVAGTAVGPREQVVIVEVGSTWLVLGVAPGRVSPLAEIPRQAVPPGAERRPTSTDFPAWLRSITGSSNAGRR